MAQGGQAVGLMNLVTPKAAAKQELLFNKPAFGMLLLVLRTFSPKNFANVNTS
jgi:hypothetical protein